MPTKDPRGASVVKSPILLDFKPSTNYIGQWAIFTWDSNWPERYRHLRSIFTRIGVLIGFNIVCTAPYLL